MLVAFFITDISPALAQSDLDLGTQIVEDNIELSGTDPRIIVVRIINVFLGLLALISVAVVLYGGWLWMTSGGDQAQVERAKKTLTNWLIGLIIIVLAWSIVNLIFGVLGVGRGGFGNQGGTPSTFFRGALGNGIIASHYPPRGAHCLQQPPSTEGCIARNTAISVTFKERMNVDSIAGDPVIATIDGEDVVIGYELDTDSVRIYAVDVETDDNGESQALAADAVIVNYTDDEKTFVFKPRQPLGSPSERMYYAVRLTNNIERFNGQSAFAANGNNSSYLWDFEVGTFLDLTPPEVQGVFPSPTVLPGDAEPRNAVVQINFNEAVDPTVVSTLSNIDDAGSFDDDDGNPYFPAITVLADTGGGPQRVAGQFSIANEYRTVEFTTFDLCGTNSCGIEVFCLPAEAQIQVVVNSALLEPSLDPSQPDGPTARFITGGGYSGVVDMAANSLNGNGEQGQQCSEVNCFGEAEPGADHCSCTIGPEADDYDWTFNTSNTIDITAPHLIGANPAVRSTTEVDVNAPVQADFHKVLMARTIVGGETAILSSVLNTINGDPENLPYWPGLQNIDTDEDGFADDRTQVLLKHTDDPFGKADLSLGEIPFIYSSHFAAGIMDAYQNCYYPSGSDGAGAGVPHCNYLSGVTDSTPSCCNGTEQGGTCPIDLSY